MKWVIRFLVAFFAFANTVFGQLVPDSLQLQAWEDFKNRNQGQWIVRWDKETGTPASIYGSKTPVLNSRGTPEEVARQFLKENRAIFKMKEDLSDLVVLRSIEDNGVFHIDMQQTYQGLRVYGGEYSIAVGADKAIQMLAGKYYAHIQSPINPTISLHQATNSAMTALGITSVDSSTVISELLVFPSNLRFILAYRLILEG